MAYLANKAVVNELDDLHRGVHLAMEALVNRKAHDEAERLLRIIDAKLTDLINRIPSARV